MRSPQPERKLKVWCRMLRTLVSGLTPGCRIASYHCTASLLNPPESRKSSAEGQRLTGSNSSAVQQKPGVTTGRLRLQQHHHHQRERSAQSKYFKVELPQFQRPNQRVGNDSKISSELRKLRLEDHPEDRERQQQRQKTRAGVEGETLEFVFGIAPCFLALTQGRRRIRKLYVKDGETSTRPSVVNLCKEAHKRGVLVSRVSKTELSNMSAGGVHQGVCLHASPLSFLMNDLTPGRSSLNPLWLVLDRIQDPMNLGAILRSAYFLGVDRVISSLQHSCPLSPVVSKASSGVMEVMDVHGCNNLERMLTQKVKRGWHVVGTVGAQAEGAHDNVTKSSNFHMTNPTLLIMGGEADGLSPELLPLCRTLITISPGRELVSGVESLNVSVAAGILMHSLLSSSRSGGQ